MAGGESDRGVTGKTGAVGQPSQRVRGCVLVSEVAVEVVKCGLFLEMAGERETVGFPDRSSAEVDRRKRGGQGFRTGHLEVETC